MAMTCWLTVQLTKGRYSPRRVPVRPVIYGRAGQSCSVASMVSRPRSPDVLALGMWHWSVQEPLSVLGVIVTVS